MTQPSTFISAQALSAKLGRPGVVVLDASWYLPGDHRDPQQEYLDQHIPGARFFDIDAIADPEHDCPHMLLSAKDFAESVAALGVGCDTEVVIYDTKGLFSAARAWWMFRVYGHHAVEILAEGLPGWLSAGLTTESGRVMAVRAEYDFVPERQSGWLADLESVRLAMEDDRTLVLDARSASRFAGDEEEPRPGVRPGHIPGSVNCHYASLLTGDPTRLKSLADLEVVLAPTGALSAESVITTCGSGISACLLALALHELGRSPVAVYDGSWAEWGGRPDCPIARG